MIPIIVKVSIKNHNESNIITYTYTDYFMSDNEPGGNENATHNTFPKLTGLF
jgi:hypothetical protein